MYKIFDFRCPCGRVEEKMVKSGTETIRCSCGKDAIRQLSAPAFILEGATGDFPGRHMRWVKEHEKAGKNNHLHNE